MFDNSKKKKGGKKIMENNALYFKIINFDFFFLLLSDKTKNI